MWSTFLQFLNFTVHCPLWLPSHFLLLLAFSGGGDDEGSAAANSVMHALVDDDPVMSADSAVTYTSVHSEARSWSIPSEDPYEEAAQQLFEQAPCSPKYVPENHIPVYILEPEHPEDLVPAEDEARDNNQKGTGSGQKLTCFECGVQGHFQKECPRLKNNKGNRGNQAGNDRALAKVYVVGNAGANPDNVVA
ncbi:reverse transcriptase domain-containing protein, partial [Tanacetum coccineum]